MSHLKLCWADVDKDREIVDEYEIYQVPYVLLQHPHKEELEQIRTPSVKALGKVLVAYQEVYLRLFKSERKKAFTEIQNRLAVHPIVVFMRGSQADPKCRSSKILIECFLKMEIGFRDYDVLKDDSLKEWLKHYSNWPSFPQVYINKKFIGGTEIILQLVEKDEFM